jgi:NhaP-type Na+/H+ or K+/H+ antiporter
LETVERVRVFKIKGLKCIIKLKSYKEFILEVNTAVETANILSWGKIIPVTIIGTLISVGVTVKLFFVKNNIDKQIRQENERKSALDILDKQLDDI